MHIRHFFSEALHGYPRVIGVVAVIGVIAVIGLGARPALAQDGVTFTDIAAGDGAGITYRRKASPSDAIFDALRQQPVFTIADLIQSPDSSRGMPGVALLDFDGDGDLDIYATNGPGAANALYANRLRETGTVSFDDVAVAAGVAAFDQDSTGVCYGDIDNDGDPDLFVLGNLEPNRLFENQGNGTFIDITAHSGLGADSLTSASCAMGDVNGDGLLDIAVANAFDLKNRLATIVEPFSENQPNQLFFNQGSNTFVDVSVASGILDIALPPEAPDGAATITWALGLLDYDLDGDLDLFFADDQAALPYGANGGIDRGYIQLFDNDGTGSFTNLTFQRNLDQNGDWMGFSFADFDRDGRMDIFGTNLGNHSTAAVVGSLDFLPVEQRDSRWFLQQQDGTYADPSDHGLLHTPFGWGTSATDYDNDGDTDIIFHGGFDFGILIGTAPGVILRNGGNADFHRDRTALAQSTDHVRRNVRGMAVGDLDNDGFIDIVSVSNFDYPDPIPLHPAVSLGGEFDDDAFIVQSFLPLTPDAPPLATDYVWSGLPFPDGTLSVELNNAENGNRWIQVEPMGTIGVTARGRVNRDGIGAVVQLTPHRGQPVLQPILGGSSIASQDSLLGNFGLARARKATVEILWPGGVRNRLYDVPAGTRVRFPEIACSFDDAQASFQGYRGCVTTALDELVQAQVITGDDRGRFLSSAIRAWHSAH